MVTEYTSKKSAHAHSEMKNVKNVTVMGTKYASEILHFFTKNNLESVRTMCTVVRLKFK